MNNRTMPLVTEMPSMKRLVAVSTRIARPAPPDAGVIARTVASWIRENASRDFGELCGVRHESDRARIFGALLAYRTSVAALATAHLGDRQTVAALRAVEAEIGEALRWAIEAVEVTS